MRRLNTSPISDTSQFPVKQGTLQFLQDANTEIFASIVTAMIGAAYDPTVVYVLFGCQNKLTAPDYQITPGVLFYNGEVFLFDGAAFVTSAGVAVASIAVTQYTANADPVLFSDNIERNVHDIRKIVINEGQSGSTIADFSNLSVLNLSIPPLLNLLAASGGQYSDNILQVLGTYPNLNLYVPKQNATAPNQVVAAGSVNLPSGNTSVYVPFASALANANYYVVITIINPNAANEYPGSSIGHSIGPRTTFGFTAYFSWMGGSVANISFEYMCFQK